MLVVGDLTDARRTFSLLAVAFRKREELSGRALVSLYRYQIPKKGVIRLLGSITLNLPTVLMKPSSYLKVTVISLIITTSLVSSLSETWVWGMGVGESFRRKHSV